MSDIYLQLILCPYSNAKHDHNALFSVLSKICCVYLSPITMQNHSSHRLFPQFCVCVCVCVVVALSSPILSNSMDCSPPGSPVHGILQARILEWVSISYFRDLPDPGREPRSPVLHRDSLMSEPPEKP